MVGASIEGNGSNSKRKLSSNNKKRSTMLMDLDILDCPICYEAFTIPIFQCDNGHLACSSCCLKLSNKCPSCALSIGQIRCRAMESVLESIFIPCRNAKLGCTENISYVKESTHAKECKFSLCSCPVQDCNYTAPFCYINRHFFEHYDIFMLNLFSPGSSITVQMKISDKILIAVDTSAGLLFPVQSFKEPYGVYVTVSCIAPSVSDLGQFSYQLSYTVDGHTMIYKSPVVKRILEVSFENPRENFMLIPNSLLRGEELVMKLCIEKLN